MTDIKLNLPDDVLYILSILEKAGHSAYAVGGCVRDSLLRNAPKDWDICTSALPEQVRQGFSQHRIAETGLKHGTVTLVLNQTPYEITTYRVDGAYTDRRRPDSVTFSANVRDDLARRDFTINAMAYHPREGLVDCFGGLEDLRARVICCVGCAGDRFDEDALRILRALRFASVLDFSIEPETAAALRNAAPLLKAVAAERIAAELNALLLGARVTEILREYTSVLAVFLPEIKPMVGFLQHNPYHDRDVWEHTVAAVGFAPPEPLLRLTMLLHDASKPRHYSEKNGVGHFYGHPKTASDMARDILLRLRYDRRTVFVVTELVRVHDISLPPEEKILKRRLNRFGEERLRQLFAVRRADMMAKGPLAREKGLEALNTAEAMFGDILKRHECCSLKELAVGGEDLRQLGIPQGPMIGQMLDMILESVMAGTYPNERNALLQAAEEWWKRV